MITIDICITAKDRCYTWKYRHDEKVSSIRVWRVIKLFGLIPIFAWVVKDEVIS